MSSLNCLTDEVLMALGEGVLSAEELGHVHRHAAGCEECRLILVELARCNLPPRPDVLSDPLPQEEESAAPDGSWTPPAQVDEFLLERPLGRGGMGVVYLAYDTSLQRQVAVKFIADSQPKPWIQESFENEALVLAQIQHPNVVQVFRAGKVQGHPFIASEYISGSSLAELALPIPWRQALGLGLGLVRGLTAAHRRGVLHRDLKPSNILVTEAGEVKLLDFGLAERLEPEPDAAQSSSRVLAGTLAYMAPELLTGAPASVRSDIYALGLVLRELCTGVPPRSDTARVTEPEPPPAGHTPLLDPDFAAIIERCCARDPEARFASVEALGEALERLARAVEPMPLAAGNPYRGLEPFEARHRALFFGRDADIHAVLERLRHQPLVLVAGDSGAGKSSLCRAGVLPQVAAGVLEDGREMATCTLWPGRRPINALAAVLAPVLGRQEHELVTLLTDTPAWLGRALREAHQSGRGLLLFIDQLEELITISESAQAAHFARILGELSLPATGVRVLLAVRGDFLTRVCALPGLGDEVERGLYILRPLSPEGVREAIAGPARRRSVSFESEALIQELMAPMARGAGSLPLLQFSLAELWERRDAVRGCITRAALEAMGGVAGALSRHADGVLARLSPAERQAARALLLRLVTAEGTRVELSDGELAGGSDGASPAALRALVEGRLLHTRTVGGEVRWEIAHDSLIESWGTLRDWLDDDIGHRVVRKRVEEASADWERLRRTREVLWGRRQLAEASSLEPSTLGARERAFLAASRRAVVRQRWGRWGAALAVALALAASYGGIRLQAYREDARFVEAHQAVAREALATGRALAQQALKRREQALALFDGRTPPPANEQGSPSFWDPGERKWDEALELRQQAEAAYAHANRALEKALYRAQGHSDTQGLLAEVTYERILLAERFHQTSERAEWMLGLEQMAEASSEARQWWLRLQAPAELELVTEPPGATVTLQRYTGGSGSRRLEPVPETGTLGPTPLHTLRLPEGSYHLSITHPGFTPVEMPVLLTHGAREQVRVELLTRVPEGQVYIPPGCFLLGSAEPEVLRDSLDSVPMHRVCLTEGYLIGRTEVTFGDWLTYLNALKPDAPARRLLEQPRLDDKGRAVTLRQSPGGGWSFSFHHTGKVVSTAAEGELFRYPERRRRSTADWRQFPLSGVSTQDLEDYFSWLDSTGRLPGARFCTGAEWEYAARGADGRRFPHGDVLLPDDANIDITYGQQPLNYGPDMVGAHPDSASPFGLVDVVGNAFEITRAVPPEQGHWVLRGGSWFYDLHSAHLLNRSARDSIQVDALTGTRVCAPVPAR
jgi:formylglycine-generating enzyme required for sulfatase activity/predicted Ser/Thr protein kinase